MNNKLSASDIHNHIFCELEIGFSQLTDRDDEEQYPPALAKSASKANLLSADDIKRQYGVSDQVASKMAGYQQDIQAEFLNAIEKVIEQSERYLRVKHLLHDKKYTDSILREYINQNISWKYLDPKRNLLKGILGVITSAATESLRL